MPLTRRSLIAGAAAAALAPRALAQEAAALSGPAFGTRWHALAPAGASPDIRRIVAAVVAETDALFSPYRDGSAISRFNRARSTDWMEVPEALAALARDAMRVHARTGGGFDASVGPLVHRYGFGPITGGPAPFAALETGTGRLRKGESALTLDLCGIAKGAALDAMIARLAPHVPDLMLELGGEIRTLGRHPDGRPWRIGVEHPLPGAPRVHRVIAPLGLAVATSGHGAQSYGTATHLIDPRRARPADMRLASVTVLARRAQDADALATALAALGPEEGPALAQARSIRALFLFNDAGRISDHVTAGFADHILA